MAVDDQRALRWDLQARVAEQYWNVARLQAARARLDDDEHAAAETLAAQRLKLELGTIRPADLDASAADARAARPAWPRRRSCVMHNASTGPHAIARTRRGARTGSRGWRCGGRWGATRSSRRRTPERRAVRGAGRRPATPPPPGNPGAGRPSPPR
jgi:hypothetical protein